LFVYDAFELYAQQSVTGVSDPQRAAAIIDTNKQRINSNVVRHLGSVYA